MDACFACWPLKAGRLSSIPLSGIPLYHLRYNTYSNTAKDPPQHAINYQDMQEYFLQHQYGNISYLGSCYELKFAFIFCDSVIQIFFQNCYMEIA